MCLHSTGLNYRQCFHLTPKREDYVGKCVKSLVVYSVLLHRKSVESHIVCGLRMLGFGVSLFQ